MMAGVGRLNKAGPWFAEIASGLMTRRLAWDASPPGRRIRIIDGTTVTAPGADKPSWRLQITFSPDAQQISGIERTPAAEGETLASAPLQGCSGDEPVWAPAGQRATGSGLANPRNEPVNVPRQIFRLDAQVVGRG